MANLLGALIGAAIDREDGDSGIKGAIVGTVAESAARWRRSPQPGRLAGRCNMAYARRGMPQPARTRSMPIPGDCAHSHLEPGRRPARGSRRKTRVAILPSRLRRP